MTFLLSSISPSPYYSRTRPQPVLFKGYEQGVILLVIVTCKNGSLSQLVSIPKSLPTTRMGIVIEGCASGRPMDIITNGRHRQLGVVSIGVE